MSILSTSSTPAAGGAMTSNGADFAQITPRMLELAAKLDIEIVGCAKGFNAYKDDDVISDDCTPEELWQWMKGFDCGKYDEKMDQDDRAAPPSASNFTDVEFQAVMKHVRYRGWAMHADHTGVKITGANFTAHAANGAEFFSFVHGFNAAGAALGMLGTRDAVDEGEGE